MWKKILFIVLIVGLVLTGLTIRSIKRPPPLPELKTGDLAFQTAPSNQNLAIIWATKSRYSHMGIITIVRGKTYIVDAGAQVRMVPFDAWRDSGYGRWVTIKRLPNLKPEDAETVARSARTYLGMPYDLLFMFDNDAIYCRELPYLAFKDVGIELGKIQKVGDLDVSNPLTEKIIRERWQMHPLCRGGADYSLCRKIIMEQPLITPRSIFEDNHLQTIYSSYPL